MTDRPPSERARRLEALHETTRELMAATERETVAEVAVEAASRVLGLDANSIHLYDEGAHELVPVAVTPTTRELIGDVPTFTPGESIAWRVYEHGEPAVFEDVREHPDVYNPGTDIRSELHLPLGEYGILIAASPTPNAFDEPSLSVAKVLAANVEAALGQADREAELVRQNERLDEFASVVSHDLRNPLTVAQGYLDVIRESGDAADFDRIESAHDRIERIIDNLLYLAREGQEIGTTEAVDLREAVESSWAVLGAENTDSRLVVDEAVTTVTADYDRLRQLLENVLGNAVAHGGSEVTVRVARTDSGFAIADDGPGIPPEQRDRVFERGYSTREDGTGFGLHIVERIADAHGWDVTVAESEAGGVRFEFAVAGSAPEEP
ncbi:GAF domain-containing sensor histidine kinase [Halorarum halobium]|uniref:GAF domain-containing sensor histidine kinase n=1 Tax=Halorarum halobium TaxID=3075121 RepID=UPI0028AD293E|nr:GAF domain-containing sensor histidine kinase [Halobaculum sp. XH14]